MDKSFYEDVNDADNYNFNVSDAVNELDHEIKIEKLEQQIAMVKERIARNERTLNNKSFEDVNNKLADLEMSKIGFRLNKPSVNQDPTSFWRWNIQRQDTQKANALLDDQKSASWQKDANYVMGAEYDKSNDASMVQAQNNIKKAIEDGRAMGKTLEDLSPLYKKLNSIQEDRDMLNVSVRKSDLIKDIQATIAEGATGTAESDINEAFEAGIIDKRDVEKLMNRLNEKRAQKDAQNLQQTQAAYSWKRSLKRDAEEDAKKSDEQYFGNIFGGK